MAPPDISAAGRRHHRQHKRGRRIAESARCAHAPLLLAERAAHWRGKAVRRRRRSFASAVVVVAVC